MKRKLYQELASTVDARLRCIRNSNGNWTAKHTETIVALVRQHMPSGGGFDNGTHIDFDRSTGECLVFTTAYHHMDEAGGYDGWTEHVVTVQPSLVSGITIRINGRNRNDVKEYMHQSFQHSLMTEVGE